TSRAFTGTFVKVTQALRVPPTPPPVKTPFCVIVEPGPIGVRVKVTGDASEMLPGLPSFTSLIAAQRVIGPAVPPGEFTLTVTGFAAAGATMGSSFLTIGVLDPTLPVPGDELE